MAKGGERSLQDVESGPQHDESDDDDSACFTDAEDEAWHSPHNNSSCACSASSAPRLSGSPQEQARGEPRASGEGDLESGIAGAKAKNPVKVEKDCRICHLNLEKAASESGAAIVLGCSCKNDLGIAHELCAEKWFKIKGNKTCEICRATARNVIVSEDTELVEQSIETDANTQPNETRRSFWQGHRFLNFLLACVVFAFVVSWLFHFNVPG
ncbi:hypothetical protein Cni_G04269 [Canna indica]|uniref:RING-CH-type domain-containing protein n=1 Tax=Canna indica TaxID=4628 RepID=A0AAQ3JT81_9LILI|nr:hypothetical protein Cni_G04269 [Canna indica]